MIDRLAKMVGIRSISGAEAALVEAVSAELRAAGLEVSRRGNNIWCRVGDQPRPTLLLNSHLDTVPPGEGWSGDPFTLRHEGDRLIGLGSNDAKGCVTAMIEAVLNLKARLDRGESLGGTVVLALTAEEETSGAGLSTVLDALQPIDAALVGEPTQMVPMIAQRGLMILRGVLSGRSSHPANETMETADNAVMKAAEQLERLREFDWGPEHSLLGRCHGNVTQINGGVAHNVIPDTCEFILDVRTTPVESHDALYARLDKHLDCDLRIHSDRLVPVDTATNAAIVEAIRSALPEAEPCGSPAMSDMVYLAGTPAVKIGPGDSRRSHTPDEFARAEELAHGAASYERIALAYFERMQQAHAGDGPDAAVGELSGETPR